MKICFYAGSFDPFTNGHLHIVREASKIFDKVIIGIGTNPDKKRKYEKELMELAIKESLLEENINNFDIVSYSGYTIDIAKTMNVSYFIRGIRNNTDYEYEEEVAKYNMENGNIDTIYIRAGEFGDISSTFVNNLIKDGRDIKGLVPDKVKTYIQKQKK